MERRATSKSIRDARHLPHAKGGHSRVLVAAGILTLAVLSFLIVATPSSAESITAATPLHHFDLPCESCHAASTGSAGADNLKDDISSLCTQSGCHLYDEMLDHPVGVQPSGPVPSQLHLDEFSRMTCLTCHADPDTSGSSNRIDLGLDRGLIRPQGLQFCASCHDMMGGTLSRQAHWQFSTRAHLGSILPGAAPQQESEPLIGSIDSESHNCLSCHDKISVTIISLGETRRQKLVRWGSMTDHPIGMDYESVASRKANRYYLPMLNSQRIRLFDGKVGCGSCHSMYAKTDNYLVDTFQKGRICMNCHNK